MLKDLEHRRVQEAPVSGGILDNLNWSGSNTDGEMRRSPLMWLAILTLVVIVGYLMWDRIPRPLSAGVDILSAPVSRLNISPSGTRESIDRVASEPAETTASTTQTPAEENEYQSVIRPIETPVDETSITASRKPQQTAVGEMASATVTRPLQVNEPEPAAATLAEPVATSAQNPQPGNIVRATSSPASQTQTAPQAQTASRAQTALQTPSRPDPQPQPLTGKTSLTRSLPDYQQWLSHQQPESFTLQIMGGESPAKLEELMLAQALPEVATVIPTFGSKRWYIVAYGSYPDIEQAQQAMSTLPASLQAAGVFPRRIANIHPNSELLPVTAKTSTSSQLSRTLPEEPRAGPAVVLKPGKMTKTIRRMSPATRAQQHYLQAVALIKQKRLQAAQRLLGDALAVYPDHAQARLTSAGVLVQQGRVNEAMALLEQGSELRPEVGQFAKLHARLLMDSGDISKAISVLEQYRPQIDRDTEYHAMLAALYQRNNRHQDAAGLYRALLRYVPNKEVWWVGLGISLEAMQSRGDALTAFRRARTLPTLSSKLQKYVDNRIAQLSQTP